MQNENDEDEDLRIFEDLDNFGDPQLDKLFKDITRHVHLLKYADLSKRVDSLVSLSDMIGSPTPLTLPVLVKASNDLIGAYVTVMMDVLDKPAEEINLRFVKYFVSIVMKTCHCRDMMLALNQESIFSLAD